MKSSYLIMGSSMAGIVAAYLLARRGCSVTLLESRRELGGMNAGVAWDGFQLDYGCHVFGNESDRVTEILLDLLDGAVRPVHLNFASILGGKKTTGFELPSLESLGPDVVGRILVELLAVCEKVHPPANDLQELLTQRYGATAAEVLGAALHKVFRRTADELAPEAIRVTTFGRIRLLDDESSKILKRIPALDERIAAGSADDPMRYYRDRVKVFPARSFYPKSRGMLGFVESAMRRLREMGVKILTEAEPISLSTSPTVTLQTQKHGELKADFLLWTSGLARLEPHFGLDSKLQETTAGVPLVLYYFATDKALETGLHYVNSFDAGDLVFRASCPGAYGADNCPPGQSYICCEVPTTLDDPVWKGPERFVGRVWEEAQRFGMAQGDALAWTIQKTPVSYKAPTTEFRCRSEAVRERLRREPRLIVPDEWTFTVNRTIAHLCELLENRAAA
jgi:phytoene dehydrogenase-like protein